MNDQITAMLSQALANALKDALVPIVREAVTEALATMPPKALEHEDPAHPSNHLEARIDTLESKVEDLESSLSDKVDSSDIDDKVSEAVSDCLDNGSWDITFRG
jgi:hypothetical protein